MKDSIANVLATVCTCIFVACVITLLIFVLNQPNTSVIEAEKYRKHWMQECRKDKFTEFQCLKQWENR